MIRRVVGILLLLIGLAGLALSVAGVMAAWHYRPILTERAAHLGGRAEELLTIATDGLSQVESVLAQARRDLEQFQKDRASPPNASPPNFKQLTLRTFSGKFISDVDGARRMLDGALDAAVVLDSVLQGLSEMSPGPLAEVDSGQLKDLSGDVRQLISKGKKLQSLLPEQGGTLDDAEVAATSAVMTAILDRVIAKAQDINQHVVTARDRVTQVNTDLPGWLMTAAVVGTVFLSWFALGQLCLLVRGWAWLRGRSA
jgi:hypothetical protein